MSQKACRTCLKLFDNDLQLISIENKKPSYKNLKLKLQTCVPEIVLSRVPNAFICITCVGALNAAYNFKTRCAEMERRISMYMEKKALDTIDLVSFANEGNISEDEVTIVDDIPSCPPSNNSNNSSAPRKSSETMEQTKGHVEDQLRCNICHFQSKSNQTMKEHMEKHGPRGPIFKCKRCDFVTNSRKAEIDHYTKHRNLKYYFCDICSYKTVRVNALRRHKTKHGASLKCKVCPFVTTDKTSLEKHNEEHDKPLKCPHCSFATNRRIALRKHIESKHEDTAACDKNPFHITVADIESILNGNPLKEISNVNNVDLSSFLVTIDEIENMLRDKVKVKKGCFKCSKCTLTFKFEHMLKRHLERKHPPDDKSQHKCDKCEFITSQKAAYKLHLATHSGRKIYSCDKCSFRTVHANYMERHKRVHNRQRALKCASCSYKTYVETNMRDHLLLHSEGKEPLKCLECEFETTDPAEMRQHNEMHDIGNEFIDNSIHGFLPQF